MFFEFHSGVELYRKEKAFNLSLKLSTRGIESKKLLLLHKKHNL
jgi:hypothetical protein